MAHKLAAVLLLAFGLRWLFPVAKWLVNGAAWEAPIFQIGIAVVMIAGAAGMWLLSTRLDR